MAIVKPFLCVRPDPALAGQVAALPYDVYNREEACREVAGHPLSFLNIDRAETQFGAEVDTYDSRVYEKARDLIAARIADGTFVEDDARSFYVYRLVMDGRAQTGIVGVSAIDDYESGVIRRHENTREDKELDRIRHVDVTNFQTGPIFLAYRDQDALNDEVQAVTATAPLCDFTCKDGVRHTVWKVEGEANARIEAAFAKVPCTYIADGHHRAASAVKVGKKRRAEHPNYRGDEPFHFFLSVLFPESQLKILPYNRVVRDLNGLEKDAFLAQVERSFTLEELGTEAFAPKQKGEFGMYLDAKWYRLRAKPQIISDDPVKGLDVSVLQDWLLGPILGIGDPRVDKRIDFIGGIRGLSELERRANSDMKVAFSMYPTSIEELLNVADAGKLMPPKSTWFEPKLRSGLFLHKLK